MPTFNKKIFIQLFFFLLIMAISLYGFYLYFYKPKQNLEITKNTNTDLTIIDNDSKESSNLIENLEYVSKDENGNTYEVTSVTGTINLDNPDIIFMNGVSAIINFTDSSPILITSDNAEYNNKNFDTIFSKNVLVTYLEHKITGEYLKLLFQDNLATMTDKVIYKNLNTTLKADILEIDLLTKNSKIFMNNSSKKIIINKKDGNN